MDSLKSVDSFKKLAENNLIDGEKKRSTVFVAISAMAFGSSGIGDWYTTGGIIAVAARGENHTRQKTQEPIPLFIRLSRSATPSGISSKVSSGTQGLMVAN